MAFLDSTSKEWADILKGRESLIRKIKEFDNFNIDPVSLPSLFIQVLFEIDANQREILSTATGFVVKHNGIYYLITNLHVVTGRHTETGKCLHGLGAVPNKLRIWHHSTLATMGYGAWGFREESLYDGEEKPLWLEHPNKNIKDRDNYLEPNVDVIALPLTDLDKNVLIHPIEIDELDFDIKLSPGTTCHIVGYPFGRSAKSFPIWKTGHIASDIAVHKNQRHFFIDATTREGMSGSPVVYRTFGPYESNSGEIIMNSSIKTRFLGIYSGRIEKDIEVGMVWTPNIIKEIINAPKNR
ncbi:serine protease [Rossellomorea oryzaecorticis]|uniref:Serine protease n=1 Tax=Rossellomorea oryzaecorticis TaxID=1396505 RepID=A0ABU9K529_9BACI